MSASASLPRTFAKYVSTGILSMVGLSLYILADTFFISARLGATGIAALNLAIPVYSLIYASGLMLGMGAATRFSVAKGRADQQQARRIFTHVCMLAAVFALFFVTAGLCFSEQIARLLGADAETFAGAHVYMRTVLLFSPAFLFNSILTCFVRNDRSPRLAMSGMLASSFSNIILDYLFLFPLDMGMFGAVFATCLAPVFSLCVLSFHFIRRKNTFSLVKARPSRQAAGKILQTGLPTFIMEFSSGFVIMIFNFLLLSLAGNTAVAAYGIIANLALVATSIFSGVAQGMQPIVGFHYGAGQDKQVRHTLFLGCAAAVLFGAFFYLGGTIFAGPIIGVFNQANDMRLAAVTENGIFIYFLAFFVMGVNVVATSFFACVLRPAASFAISILRGFAAVLPAAFLLAALLGINGVWASVPAAEGLTFIISLILLWRYIRRGKPGARPTVNETPLPSPAGERPGA